MEVDREWRRVQRVGGESRDTAEIEIEVLDLAGPIADEADLGAAADCEACLCRGAGEAAARRARAGGDGGGFERDLDPGVDRGAGIIQARGGGGEDALGGALDERKTVPRDAA